MSNDNDKCQEYQKNMGKRLRKIRKRMHCLRMMLRMLLVYAQSSIRDTIWRSAISCEKLSILEESFILMCDHSNRKERAD